MTERDDFIAGSIFVNIADTDGIIATHPTQIEFPRRVTTSQPGDGTRNTIKEFLIVLGCMVVPDGHFEFDSSFVRPEAKAGFRRLAELFDDLTDETRESDQTPPLSIFGHADPVGNDAYNSILSGRRARAIHAMLTRDAGAWEELFSRRHPMGGDIWGDSALQTMAETVAAPVDGGPAGEPETLFRSARANQGQRRTLILAYMDLVCVRASKPTGREVPFRLTSANFLARGADANGKGDLQGCGEFNPSLLLSRVKLQAFQRANDKPGRDAANERNRRVLAFLFKPGSRIDPTKWPCPHVKDPNAVAVCTRRFWSDAERRRAPDQEVDREFKKTRDTFACRFYHGIAQDSPCEGVHRQWVVRVLRDIPRKSQKDVPLANIPFGATMASAPDAPRIRSHTDAQGGLRLPVLDEITTIQVEFDVTNAPGTVPGARSGTDGGSGGAEKRKILRAVFKAGDLKTLETEDEAGRQEAIKQRLYNLGYGLNRLEAWDEATFTRARRAFKKHQNIARSESDSDFDDAARARLKEVHEGPLPRSAPA